MRTYGLIHPTLLVKPLAEIKEGICSVLETLDEPLCSSQILDDTEDLLACLNSQDLLDGEEPMATETVTNEELSSSSYPIFLEDSPYSVGEETLTCTEASPTQQTPSPQQLNLTDERAYEDEGSQTLGDFEVEDTPAVGIVSWKDPSASQTLLDIPSIQIEDFDRDGDNGNENVFVVGMEKEMNELMEEENESVQILQTKLKKILASLCFLFL